MAELTTKYLDLGGLSRFWSKVKEYITTQNTNLDTALNNKIDANDAAIRSYLESLTVNGQKVVKSPTEGLGTALSVAIKGEHIVVGGATGDYKDMNVDAAILAVDGRIDALELKVDSVVNEVEVTAVHDDTEGDTTTEWVKVDQSTTSAGDGKGVKVSVTIDDTAIDSKFESIDQDIATLTANAGVTEIKVVDTNKGTANYVDVSFTGNKEGYTEGYERGQMTITIDETALDNKIEGLDLADSNEAASRKADVELLAGAGYTAGVDGAVGTWADANKPTYKTIASLSNRLDVIDANVVTRVEESADSKETYVKLDVANSADSGDSAVTIKIDDDLLAQKVTALETADADEATARKAHDKALGGADWTEGTGWTGTTTSYHDITTLGQHMKLAEDKIDALSTATHFIGVSSTEITNGGTQKPTIGETAVDPVSGDVVIYGHKEFIWSAGAWVELGDTTTENLRIGALETWVDNNKISDDEIDALFAEQTPENGAE